jgi:hypothetical protein
MRARCSAVAAAALSRATTAAMRGLVRSPDMKEPSGEERAEDRDCKGAAHLTAGVEHPDATPPRCAGNAVEEARSGRWSDAPSILCLWSSI